jgi:hypothetical protein
MDHAEGGLHHGLAHTACAIIAANRHDVTCQSLEMVHPYPQVMTMY